MMKKISFFKRVFAQLTVFLLVMQPGFACVDFILKCQDGTYINGRSLEFALTTPTHIEIHPRGESFQSYGPGAQKGLSWTSKHAYASLAAFDKGFVVGGFNEKGISFNALWFPDVKYPPSPSSSSPTVLDLADIGAWILGNFATVEEVKKALQQIQFYTHEIPELKQIPPLHIAMHDTEGESLVVEFIEGKMQLFDNPVGVLTNAPSLTWQLTNLRNYVNLTAVNSAPKFLDQMNILPTGQGTGLLGIPGDWTPPSRFVRIALFKQFIHQPEDGAEGANAAFHLLNTVDIPYGVVKAVDGKASDYTQWSSVADLTSKKLYVRTYGDLNIQTIDFSKENLDVGAKVRKIPIGAVPY
jgi:choloylglycine hydrolase